jgi:hypothetical protein
LIFIALNNLLSEQVNVSQMSVSASRDYMFVVNLVHACDFVWMSVQAFYQFVGVLEFIYWDEPVRISSEQVSWTHLHAFDVHFGLGVWVVLDVSEVNLVLEMSHWFQVQIDDLTHVFTVSVSRNGLVKLTIFAFVEVPEAHCLVVRTGAKERNGIGVSEVRTNFEVVDLATMVEKCSINSDLLEILDVPDENHLIGILDYYLFLGRVY